MWMDGWMDVHFGSWAFTLSKDCSLEISHIFVDPNLNSRPEYVAGVNDSTSRRWGTIEVSVPNLWKDNVGQDQDEATR